MAMRHFLAQAAGADPSKKTSKGRTAADFVRGAMEAVKAHDEPFWLYADVLGLLENHAAWPEMA